MGKTLKILVADRQLVGAASKGKIKKVEKGEEITSSVAKALGLGKKEIELAIDQGAILEIDARAASAEATNDEVAKANSRAEAAETELASTKKKLAEVVKQRDSLQAQVDKLKPEEAN